MLNVITHRWLRGGAFIGKSKEKIIPWGIIDARNTMYWNYGYKLSSCTITDIGDNSLIS